MSDPRLKGVNANLWPLVGLSCMEHSGKDW
jgi:hypothetical protein